MLMSVVDNERCPHRPTIGLPIDSSFSFHPSFRIVISLFASSC
jgi:hypothetical protein